MRNTSVASGALNSSMFYPRDYVHFIYVISINGKEIRTLCNALLCPSMRT